MSVKSISKPMNYFIDTSNQTQLKNREFLILESLINSYIESGEPIGSRTLSKIISLSISPATIRNIMADLEEDGYLYQPHTSAGRLPTDKGFRYYVDRLLSSRKLEKVDSELIKINFSKIDTDMGEFFSHVSEYLSEASGEAAIVITPDFETIKLRNLNLVKLSEGKIVVILESESGFVYDKIIRLDYNIDSVELNNIQNYINSNFSHHSISDIKQKLMRVIDAEKNHYDNLLLKAVEIASQVFDKEIEMKHFEDLYIKGTSKIINNLEIGDLDSMKELLSSFERKSHILEILNLLLEDWQRDDIYICIGNEIPEELLSRFSIIAAPYLLKGGNFGFLGVIGPKRMNYSFTISLVNQIARKITELFQNTIRK